MGERKLGDDYIVFEDYFPAMMEKLGAEGLMEEVIKGFRLLMEGEKGVITMESLKRNVVGLQFQDEDMVRSMLSEGDLNGDGCLDLFEFCVLMFRLSPTLMDHPAIFFPPF